MQKRIRQFQIKLRADQPPLCWKFAVWGLISSTLAIYGVFWMASRVGHPLLIGSFGASAVLLFGAPDSLLSQPRNVVGGHLVSACLAVSLAAVLGTGPWVASVAVGGAILAMYLTRTLHPPGGATALIGVQGHGGWLFPFVPVLAGALMLLVTALFTNNIVYHRKYPKHWI